MKKPDHTLELDKHIRVEPPSNRPPGDENGGDLQDLAAAGPELSSPLFGPYRAVRELGRGGMGVVYLAERIDGQFDQRVALKVIQRGAAQETIERFARERQILANLRHPNIARLLDAGVSEAGDSYLVMEPVFGIPIDRYCADHRLSIAKRLELLSIVCEAVQAAHRQLVVHRDIKPSNVLVTASSEVKLLDFGIAALMEPSERDPITATEARVMTPQYASPEQLRGAPITVASDVYQLGLLAYELLAGRRPYEFSALGPAAAIQKVCDEMPPPPSTASVEPTERDADSKSEPSVLRVSGELDLIVLKALRKDPEQRYASADLLRADIENYVAGKPISARPPTASYRLRKFVQRNAIVVGAGAVALTIMVAMASAFTVRLLHERDLTRRAAERAERLRIESQEVTSFLIELFEVADPDGARGETITARELLDRGAARIEHELAAQPLVKVRLLRTIATISRRLGLYGEAQTLFEKALAIPETESEPSELVANLDGLATVLRQRSQFEEANAILERALELAEDQLGPGHAAVGRILHHLGLVRDGQGRIADAEPLLRRALAILTLSADRPDELAEVTDSLGIVLRRSGRYDEAASMHEEAIAALEATLGPDHPRLVGPLNHLATVWSLLGQHDRTLPLFERAYRLQHASYGPEHPETAAVLNNLGINYLELDRFDEAEATFTKALAILHSYYGPDHPDLGNATMNLGNVSLERKQFSRAETFYRRALAILEPSLDPHHPQIGFALNNLGEAVAAQRSSDEARLLFRRSLEIFEAALGPEHLVASWPVLNLARLDHERRDFESAEVLYRRAVEIRRRVLEPSSADRQESEEAWMDFLRQLGREDEFEAGGD